jgi:hypothetical protein
LNFMSILAFSFISAFSFLLYARSWGGHLRSWTHEWQVQALDGSMHPHTVQV